MKFCASNLSISTPELFPFLYPFSFTIHSAKNKRNKQTIELLSFLHCPSCVVDYHPRRGDKVDSHVKRRNSVDLIPPHRKLGVGIVSSLMRDMALGVDGCYDRESDCWWQVGYSEEHEAEALLIGQEQTLV